MSAGIYLILCLPNRKIYVGQSVNASKRIKTHKYRLNKGIHTNLSLQRAWKKHGKDLFLFHIIEHCKEKDLQTREKFWMNRLQSTNPKIGFNK